MATAERTFTVLDTADRVWSVVSDLPNWNRLFAMDDARKRGWGDRFVVRSGSGRGALLAMTDGRGRVFQEWEIEEWAPPQRLRLASRRSFNENSMTDMQSTIEVAVMQVSQLETQVVIRFDASFSHPLWSLMLAFVPLKGQISRVLTRMEKGLIAALSSA